MLINSARTLGGSVNVYVPVPRPACNADTGVCPAWVQVRRAVAHRARGWRDGPPRQQRPGALLGKSAPVC